MSTKTSSSSVSNSRNNEKDKGRIKINMTLCKYEVVKKIVKDRGWKMVTDENDKAGIASCNLHWIDVPDFLATWKILLPYQKVNHFPGMSNLARKSKLARNFERMRKLFPEEYDFCPRTWILPFDMNDFQQQFNADGSSSKTFIIKPDHSCQGRGVFLTKNLHQVSKQDILVAQSYLTKPLLIDNKKFDLRIYVLITSCHPLRVYLFQDGLVRMCTADYVIPNEENMEQRFMHLTNYAVNKHSSQFEKNQNDSEDGKGSKRSLKWFLNWLKEKYPPTKIDILWEKIGDICLKAILAVQPTLEQEYKSQFAKNLRVQVPVMGHPSHPHAHPHAPPYPNPKMTNPTRPSSAQEMHTPEPFKDDVESENKNPNKVSSCFSILGMDVLVDETLKPWLLEVNHLPSFGCDSPLDWNIKERLINQTLDLLDLSSEDREKWEAEQALSTQIRLYGGGGNNNNNNNNYSNNTIKSQGFSPQEQYEHKDNKKTFHALDKDQLHDALENFYRCFNPERLKDLDKIVDKYGNQQDELDISLRTKYGKGIQEFVVVSTMKQKEKLIDFILMYPPPLNKDMIKSKYQDILEASQNQMKEQYMRFSAPLQHRKTDEKTMNDTFLPAIKGAKKQEEKKPLVMPGPQQIAAAHRLMMGHSSTKTSIQPPTPPQQIKEPLQKKSSINYGLVYREKIEGLKNKPTIAMSQITFGSFG